MSFTRLLILLCAVLVWAHPATAAGGGGKKGKKSGPSNVVQAGFTLSKDNEQDYASIRETILDDSPQAVDIQLVSMPVTVDGRLSNYLYVSVRLIVADGLDAWKVREQSHWVRDAIVRGAHSGPSVGMAQDINKLDEAVVIALVRDVVDETLGPEAITDIRITSVDSQADF